jgi:phospholipase C
MRNRALAACALLAACAVGALPAHAEPTKPGPNPQQNVPAPQLTGPSSQPAWPSPLPQQPTSTPIKHLVVLFQENISFDHYFGTYPNATNPPGEPQFTPAPGTPSVKGLSTELLTDNPNLSNPQRLDRSQAHTCDQDHSYTAEQEAFDHGLMDRFVQDTGHQKTVKECTGIESGTAPNYAVMDYYDGNTVTGLWNYAQNFALSDNSYGTGFGPSSPGAINVTAGNTYGVVCGPSFSTINAPECPEGSLSATTPGTPAKQGAGTMYSDEDPYWDTCSYTEDGEKPSETAQMGGKNIGDLLDERHITWGWFEGGFASPGYVPGKPSTDELSKVCTQTHKNIAGEEVNDYIPHHEPFQYYSSTANPDHLPPTSITMVGRQDQANHQYDIRDFWAAAESGNMPAVSYIKAPAYEDGHAGYSDPLDEQRYLAETINRLEKLPSWRSTAVIINWDDSDGWYDHQFGPIVRQSQTALDALTGTGECGSNPLRVPLSEEGVPEQGRCGVGPRIPLLAISPYSKSNYIDNTFTTQTSVVRFIENNWLGGRRIGGGSADATTGGLEGMFDFQKAPFRRLFLNPETGEPASPIYSLPTPPSQHPH